MALRMSAAQFAAARGEKPAKAKKPTALELKINPCNRLLKDLVWYGKEKAAAQAKADAVPASDAHELGRQREFLRESTAAFDSTRGKLRDSINDLTAALRLHRLEPMPTDAAGAAATNAVYDEADRVIRTALGILDGPAAAAAAAAGPSTNSSSSTASGDAKTAGAGAAGSGRPRVAVFGASVADRSSALWKTCEDVGQRLAAAGYHVMSGGYFGTMEAVCAGAAKVPGAVIEGVLCPAAFPGRDQGNAHLTVRTVAPTLSHRLTAFMEPAAAYSPAIGSGGADYFVVLPGAIGTLAEFVVAWNLRITNAHIAAAPAQANDAKATVTATATAAAPTAAAAAAPAAAAITPTIFAFRAPWEAVATGLVQQLGMKSSALQHIVFVDSAAQIIERLPASA